MATRTTKASQSKASASRSTENEDGNTTEGGTELPDGTVAQPLPMSPAVERFEDSHGVVRIAGVPVDNWEPAPLDPDPELVAFQEARAEEVKASEEELQARLTADEPETSSSKTSSSES